jgi:5'-nucleotidase
MTRILVTNDDGVESPGLRHLAEALGRLGEVVVVAPDREQSASGHALTLHRPLRLRELSAGVYSVDGTPTDCVNLAILWLLEDRPPDLVVSGINQGLNLGDDVTYSGTVSATFEGLLLGVPSVAFSQELGEDHSFERSAELAARLVEALLERELPRDLLLNVNLPAAEPRGVRFTRLVHRVYQQVVVQKLDPRGKRYFWIAGSPEWKDEEGTDHGAIVAGYVSVTPLHLDLTDYRRLEADEEGLVERLTSLL